MKAFSRLLTLSDSATAAADSLWLPLQLVTPVCTAPDVFCAGAGVCSSSCALVPETTAEFTCPADSVFCALRGLVSDAGSRGGVAGWGKRVTQGTPVSYKGFETGSL